MLTADGLDKRFGAGRRAVTVLQGASLRLAPGARVGLTGPSGCGKSTLAAVLALLVAPDAGTVTVDEERVLRWGRRAPATQRRRVQLLWQSPRQATDPRMTLREVVGEPLAAAREPGDHADRVAAAMEQVGLRAELWARHPHEVSEGQLQRACVARALILGTRYLICDEPTSMLDVSTQAAVLRVIADAQRERGLGVLLVTHDTRLARHWCDDVLAFADLARPAAEHEVERAAGA